MRVYRNGMREKRLNTAILLGFLMLINFSCFNEKKEELMINPENISVVFPSSRTWLSPNAFREPETNPPSLLWPVKESGDYSVRLSLDSSFREGVIEQVGLPWAMYNPHQKLALGTWYWQVKYSGENWGESAAFVISNNTRTMVTPTGEELMSRVPVSHPRVLVWADSLRVFRANALKHEESNLIIKEANDLLKNTLPEEKDAVPTFTGDTEYQTAKIAKDFSKEVGIEVLNHVEPICQAYLLTGDEKYFETALKWARTITKWDPDGPTATNDFSDSQIMYSLALIYDSFYDKLGQEDKTKIIEAVKSRVHHFYGEWNNYLESRQLSNHVWQYNLYRLFMTSLAVIGDVPEAYQWMNYCYEIWLARSPVLGGNDGGWVHGVSYFYLNAITLTELPLTLQDLTGVNFMGDAFYEHNLEWFNYSFPPHSTSDGFGDGSEGKYAPDLEILGYVDAISRLKQSSLGKWYINKVLDGKKERLVQNENFRWFRLRRGYEMALPVGLPENDLPLARVFQDAGLVYMNTDLNDYTKNLMITMRSSPYGSYSHMHADQNTFNIAYGGKRLFFNAGHKISMGDKHSVGYYKATQGHNGILIDGEGQTQSDKGWGYVPRFLTGKEISYAVGDASHAYGNGKDESSSLKQYRRHITMLRPDLIIIYDELEKTKSSYFSWLIHDYEDLEIDSSQNKIITRNEVATGTVTLVGSQPLRFDLSNEFTIEPVDFRNEEDKRALPNHWHFKATNEKESESMRFLAIIQVTPLGQAVEELVWVEEGKYDIGDWQIEAELDVSKLARISVLKKDHTAGLSSSGQLSLGKSNYADAGSRHTTLVEVIDGKEKVMFTSDSYPEAFIEASAYSNKK